MRATEDADHAEARIDNGPTQVHTCGMSARAVGAVVACVLSAFVAACSTNGCGNEKCGPPQLSSHVLHLAVDGRAVSSGGGALVNLKTGRLTTLSLSIDRAPGVRVRNVYLLVNSDPFTNGPDTPTGRVKIVSHYVGALPVGRSVVGTWLPRQLFGPRQMYVTARYDLGDARVAETAARLSVTS